MDVAHSQCATAEPLPPRAETHHSRSAYYDGAQAVAWRVMAQEVLVLMRRLTEGNRLRFATSITA